MTIRALSPFSIAIFSATLFCLQACGGGVAFPPSLSSAATGAATHVYVTQLPNGIGNGSILQFSANATAATPPTATLAPPAGLTLEALNVDANGLIYIGARTPATYASVYVYAANPTASAQPLRVLQIASGANPGEIAFDTSGNIYVAADAEIDVFAPGTTTPYRTISGAQTGLTEIDGIVVNSQGEIVVTNAKTGIGQVFVFSATANGNVPPQRTILGVGSANFYDPSGIALDASGNIFVAAYLAPATTLAAPSSIFMFAPNAAGFATPIKRISGNATGLAGVGSLKFDGAGNLFVLVISPVTTSSGTTYQPSVSVFAPGASGNSIPLRSFTSNAWTSPGYGQIGLD
jgi:hypothetical protein